MYANNFIINKNFQSSVNLELDLNNKNKIKEYIPTTDICLIIKKYIKTILHLNNDYATLLVGPYGKGKSFLLLVINYLLDNNKDDQEYDDLLNKIKLIDQELYDLLIIIKNEKINLLPIIINSNYDNIRQAYLLALKEALERNNLHTIIPKTSFEVCIELINKWINNKQIYSEINDKCQVINSISLEELKDKLSRYDEKAYAQLENLYNSINIGFAFNPFVNADIVKLYKDTLVELNKNGYSGIFIVFDEFSKFLESNDNNLGESLKIIQDFAEVAARSNKKSQINLCCVTHKSLALYNENDNVSTSIKTVEGRFKEIKFNRSLNENYELISSVIYKTADGIKITKDYIDTHYQFYNDIEKLNIFDNQEALPKVFYGCYPLNPLSVYILIKLSELVAQNERTLFTFLSDSNQYSLATFLKNNNENLANTDLLYEYFSPLFQKDQNDKIREYYYRTESILAKVEDITQRKIIKVIAVLLIIDDFNNLPPKEHIISLALKISYDDCCFAVNQLLDVNLLHRNHFNDLLSLATYDSSEIENYFKVNKMQKLNNDVICNVLTNLIYEKYVLPRKYNSIHKMTRFYKVIFLTDEMLNNLYDFSSLFEEYYCDGIIINLLPSSNLSHLQIKNKIDEIGDKRVIIRFPLNDIKDNFYVMINRYCNLKELKKSQLEDTLVNKEIAIQLEELDSDLNIMIDTYYNNTSLFYTYDIKQNSNFIDTLNNNLEDVFPINLIINNELINKKKVSSQYLRAIENIVNNLLLGESIDTYDNSSPEGFIYQSVLVANKNNNIFRSIIEEIKNNIIAQNNFNFTEVINKYRMPPYGLRDGIIPLMSSIAVSELSDNIVLYFKKKEIELNASNLIKAHFDERYYLFFSYRTREQQKFLNNMLKMFNLESCNNFNKDTIRLCNEIRRNVLGLPLIIRSNTLENNYLNLDESIIKYMQLFMGAEINAYNYVFIKPQTIFNERKYASLIKLINVKMDVNSSLDNYKNNLIKKVKKLFGVEDATCLKLGLKSYCDNILNEQKLQNQKFYDFVNNNLNYDDYDAINNLSKFCIHLYIEDYNNDKTNELMDSLMKIKNQFMKIDNSFEDYMIKLNFTKETLSPMGNLFKNSLVSTIEEYAESIDKDEKIAILSEILKDLM